MSHLMLVIILGAGLVLFFGWLRQYRRQQTLALYISRYGDQFGRMVAHGRIGIGMSSEMLAASWGEPDKTDGKVIREEYYKVVYHYGARPDHKDYKYRITLVNDKIVEIRED